ncbi:plasmid maintenance system antidote protein [Bifidobacterium margollesii]|uniref:Plasmid maintenance system antidote protein n=1 Tax=Bifidobacterium margollesii TaxID=2020964 RepID=A0A2N5J6S6_9BIFI|nr:helix-turn-helix transcriptional regulator [Bifidobacterium margollesii]PLS29908.1 plasmid maintenance system antidote protein [Bifidobacterium margollesii]
MTAATASPMTKDSEQRLAAVIAFNIKVSLAAKGRSQTALAEALGIKRSAMSQKMTGRTGWSIIDLVNASRFLGTSIEHLIDDSLLNSMDVPENEKTVAGDSRPRFLVAPAAGLEPATVRYTRLVNHSECPDFTVWLLLWSMAVTRFIRRANDHSTLYKG